MEVLFIMHQNYVVNYYPNKLKSNKEITGVIARRTSIPVENFEKVIKKLNLHNELQAREHRMVCEFFRGQFVAIGGQFDN